MKLYYGSMSRCSCSSRCCSIQGHSNPRKAAGMPLGSNLPPHSRCHVRTWHSWVSSSNWRGLQLKTSFHEVVNSLMACLYRWIWSVICVDTKWPRQNGRHFPNDIFKWIFFNKNVWISIKISLKFVCNGPINNIPSLVQIMALYGPGDKPLSEPKVVRLPAHIWVTAKDLMMPHQ